MHDRIFDFETPPFRLSPDARFFYASRGHTRAMTHLTFGLEEGDGFVVITGEIGAGKTTLIEHLLTTIDPERYAIARIATTRLAPDDLFRLAVAGLGVEIGAAGGGPAPDRAVLLLRFEAALDALRAAGRRAVLIVDEAQNLSHAALEELRMLSNLAADGQTALQTILLGQPEFRSILAGPALDQLRQRVIASFHLAPLAPDETRAYLEHRLGTVGWTGRPALDADAVAAVHAETGGVPRRINRLFARVLLLASLDGQDTITGAMVGETARELAADLDGPDLAARPPAWADPAGRGEPAGALIERLERLERAVERREILFGRLDALFASR